MYDEDDLLPVSALQHLIFCERQCALIHLERVWAENPLTVEGKHMHGRVDGAGPRRELRGDVIISRGVALRSLRLGLIGKADVVEFHRAERKESDIQGRASAVPLPDAVGLWVPFPVDYKHGAPKRDRSDEIQLCAQALCLEEMLTVEVPQGALFYGNSKRRFGVVFDGPLRRKTEETALRLRRLLTADSTPRAFKEPKCAACSLLELCLPEAMAPRRSASRYLEAGMRLESEDEGRSV